MLAYHIAQKVWMSEITRKMVIQFSKYRHVLTRIEKWSIVVGPFW